MRVRLVLGALVVSSLAVASAGFVDAGQRPQAPTDINWSPCYRNLASEINQDLVELGQPPVRYECATVRVPLDHSRSNGGTINLSLVRVPAAGPADDARSLFLNPGGPGGSGVDFALFFGPFIGLELGTAVREGFDVVGFDPRGIWRSTPIRCFGNERQGVQTFPPVAYPLTPQEVDATVAGVEALAERCDRGAKRPSEDMSTANVARDLDLLRQAVGDDQLNFLGLSYGSFLGQTYANLFPERVGAMVIDGVLDPEAWVNVEGQIPFSSRLRSDLGARATLEQFFELCDLTPGDGDTQPGECLLSGDGGTAADRFEAIIDGLAGNPIPVVDPFSGEPLLLTEQEVIGITTSILYNPFDYYFLAELLALIEQAVLADSAGAASSASAALGSFLGDLDANVALVNKRGFPNYENFVEGFPAVACSDSTSPTTVDAWIDPGLPDPDEYFGKLWDWASIPCLTWPRTDEARYAPGGPTGWGAETANPVLVIGNFYDPATRYQGAVIADELLPNSALLSVDDPGHTSLGISPFCAGPITGSYLLDPESTAAWADGVVCQSLLEVTGLNWIDLGAPPPDQPPPMMQVGAEYRHRLMPHIAYLPTR